MYFKNPLPAQSIRKVRGQSYHSCQWQLCSSPPSQINTPLILSFYSVCITSICPLDRGGYLAHTFLLQISKQGSIGNLCDKFASLLGTLPTVTIPLSCYTQRFCTGMGSFSMKTFSKGILLFIKDINGALSCLNDANRLITQLTFKIFSMGPF